MPISGAANSNVETLDAPADILTPYRVVVGGFFEGEVSASNDHDWVAIDLQAGTTYRFHMLGLSSEGGTLSDPILSLRDDKGNLITHDDDTGANLDCLIVFTANTTGTFFLDATSYGQSPSSVGTYTLWSTLEAAAPQSLIFKGTSENDTETLGDGHDRFDGLGGDDTGYGGLGNDTLYGGLGNDLLFGGAGFDRFFAGEGEDTVFGGLGRDHAFLGVGNDVFNDTAQGGFLGSDTVFAGAGNDTIQGGNGNDYFYGEQGNDLIIARLGNDVVAGGAGRDRLFGGEGSDTLFGGSGADTINGENGNDSAFLGSGNDVFNDNAQSGLLGRDTVFAGEGDDTIQGGQGDDQFYGDQGDDLIFARLGNDLVVGGDGNDRLFGGNGNDTLFGGLGDDTLTGGEGNDVVFGGDGSDLVFLGAGNDRFRPAYSSDADDHFDTVHGGGGNDHLSGSSTANLFFAEDGNDTLMGLGGDDTLDGGAGNDLLLGGEGNDILSGGSGNNTLTGGGGVDEFRIVDAVSLDTIADFQLGIDKLHLTESSWGGGLAAAEVVTRFGTVGVSLDFGTGQILVLEGLESLTGLANDIRGNDGRILRGVVELSDVEAGMGGFVINGISAEDYSGTSVSGAGDVNGDGFDDLIVGAPGDDPNGISSGASFVVFGKADGSIVELSEVQAGRGGFGINGVSFGDNSGAAVSGAGDVNGDGLDDLIVGALVDDPNGSNAGASFVVFGKADGSVVELSDVEAGSGGFVINGVSALDLSGGAVDGAGDVNGDGFDDLIVGAFGDDPNDSSSGASFVVFGKADGSVVELSDVEAGTGGFVINGVSRGDSSGVSVSGAGDVNGDGFDDLIVGARYAGPNGNRSGASYVVFGKVDGGVVELSDVEAGAGGFVINGVSAGDMSGRSVSSAGDVNGDGFDDLIIGAYGDDPNGSSSGASFVVFGKTDGSAVELSDIEAGTGGFVINGLSSSDHSGLSVSGAGDVNGDGFDDLIVGAYGSDPNGSDSGASFVVYGKVDGDAVELSAIELGTGGFAINGVSAGDIAGRAVSGAGDVNGDGFDDLIVGAFGDDPNGSWSGASFVVFGGDFTGAATQIGTVNADLLTGSVANDVIFAGIGDDSIDGGGGTDRLSGGQGADVLIFSNLEGTTSVVDFEGPEGDLLDISDFNFANFAAVQGVVSASGPGGHDTRIDLDADTVVILEGVTPDTLTADDFLLL